MVRYLLENPDDLEENPRRSRRRSARRATRRGGKRGRKARARARRAFNSRRKNPMPFFGGGGKRRRRGSRRRSSGRRRNPFSVGGLVGGAGGVVHVARTAVGLFAAEWAGDFAATVLRGRVSFLQRWRPGVAQMLVGVLGGMALKRFGGPLRKYAGSFAAVNAFMGLRNVVPFQSGGGMAQSRGLGDILRVSPRGSLGYTEQQSYGLADSQLYGGLGDYLTNADVSAYALN